MKKIFLVGFMGSGKSTLGRKVARELSIEFIDLDRVVEEQWKMTIPDIFNLEQEKGFRQKERQCLVQLCDMGDCVIATGGGTPTWKDNMTWMHDNGLTVYLQQSPEVLCNRLLHSKEKRPLIEGMNRGELLTYIQDILKTRDRFYLQAQLVVPNLSNERRKNEELVTMIKNAT